MTALDDRQVGTARQRWADGHCPCCGQPLDTDRDGNPPVDIGRTVDGAPVRICGECQRRAHHQHDIAPALIHAIDTGVDP